MLLNADEVVEAEEASVFDEKSRFAKLRKRLLAKEVNVFELLLKNVNVYFTTNANGGNDDFASVAASMATGYASECVADFLCLFYSLSWKRILWTSIRSISIKSLYEDLSLSIRYPLARSHLKFSKGPQKLKIIMFCIFSKFQEKSTL